jgi:hypothetical protein
VRELYIFCEGSTEQGFANQVLSKHLFPGCEGCVHTIKIAASKRHGIVHRGGVAKYAALRRDIQNTLKSRRDGNIFFTSLIDLYGLPSDFPGKAMNVYESKKPAAYVLALEAAFGDDIEDARFVPYLQLHEYETMLFSDATAFRIAFDDCDVAVQSLAALAASVPSIEHINDGFETAPSKRIIGVLPAYEGRKSSAGPDIAEYIGVTAIRAKCPHFDEWLKKLETLYWKS